MLLLNIAGLVILGWLAGYAVNYLGDVLPLTRSFSQPVCLVCQARGSWLDTLTFRHCTVCGSGRSARTWIVMGSAVAITLATWFFPSYRLGFWPGWFLLIYFGVVAVIDIEHRLILHPVSLFGALLLAVYGVWLHDWLPTLLGGAAGFLMMFALYWLGEVFSKWLARMRGQEIEEVALGFGDVNLSGILGLLLGWPGITLGLLGAILLGGLGSLLLLVGMLIARRYQAFTAIPYAPFLILSAVMLLFRP